MAKTTVPTYLSAQPSIIDAGDATAITIDSSENISIGGQTNHDGAAVLIAHGDSGVTTYSDNADELVIENNTNAGISILTPANGTGSIIFGDSNDDDIGKIEYNHSTDDLTFTAADDINLVTGSGNVGVTGTMSVSGAITANLTGNASGTAATVTTAAQPAITSVGTLTSLIVSTGGSTAAQGDTDLLVRHNSATSTTAQVQILAGNAGYSNLYLSDTDAYNVGGFIYNHSSNYLATNVNGAERLRIASAGQLGIGGANYGTDGQVLTSTGASTAPAWEDAASNTVLQNNIAILAFQVGTTAAAFQMQDQFVDDFNDHTGIDADNSTAYASGNDSYTVLLIHSDAADGNTTFTDSGVGGATHTIAYEGNPDHSTDQAKFGASSIHLDGTDFLKTYHATDFDFGTDPFSIDLWWYPTSQGSYDRFVAGGNDADGANQQWFFGKWPSNNFNIGYKSSSSTYTETSGSWGTVSNNDTWHHVAMERSGAYIYAYMDGVKKISWNLGSSVALNTGAGVNSYNLLVGQRWASGNNVEPVTGYVDEVRISKGIARWGNSNFTPETEAYGGGTGFVGGDGANMTLISTTQTAQSTPTKANLVFLMEDAAGTATINTDIKAYVSRNAGSNWSSALTLVDQGTWGANKKILVANDVDISSLTGTTALRYKVTTHNQSGSKKTKLHGASMAWA